MDLSRRFSLFLGAATFFQSHFQRLAIKSLRDATLSNDKVE